jgi:HlyD family secretion protein
MAEPKERRKISSNTLIWTGAVLALILIFYGVRQITRERLPIRVASPEVQDLIKTSSGSGKVEPINNFEAHAPVPGVVEELYVREGERVPKGKLLLRLNQKSAQASLSAAAAALRGAEANLQMVQRGGTQQQQLALTSQIANAKLNRDQAARDLAAVQKLEAQGAAAPDEVVQAQQRLAVATASLASLEQQHSDPFAPVDLAHARSAVAEAQAAYSAAEQTLAQCNVRAPFAGVVYSLPVARYDYVQPGATLLSMADLSRMRVRAYFDEPDIGNLQLGDPVKILWSAKQGEMWHGEITALPSTIMPYGTRYVGEALISIDSSDDDLLPNTNVTVNVTTQSVPNALTLPREALNPLNGRNYVYVVSGDSLVRRQVQLGTLNLTDMQILSGVSKDAVVALGTTNGAPLSEGMPIRIVR